MKDITLKNFQSEGVFAILKQLETRQPGNYFLQAPTGAGKTVILIEVIERYLQTWPNTVVFWLCPGKGDLEEQSYRAMRDHSLHPALLLDDALSQGIKAGDTVFVNWEKVNRRNPNQNIATREGELPNLLDHCSLAANVGCQFLTIIDEEHANNTENADELLKSLDLNRYPIVRVSATLGKAEHIAPERLIKIADRDVIEAGLIARAISINEGITQADIDANADDLDRNCYLISKAEEKRQAIAKAYQQRNIAIRPLVLIQLPNGKYSQELQERLERHLNQLGISYENGLLACWLSDKKKNTGKGKQAAEDRNLEDITNPNATPVYLICKQAITTGWDCPRAKILVKLRENSDEKFEIQTIGRIRRMPERHHYGDRLLDYCYVYTFDQTFKAGLFESLKGQVFNVHTLTRKDKCGNLHMTKETRSVDGNHLDEKEICAIVHSWFVTNYGLASGTKEARESNRTKLQEQGYRDVGAQRITHTISQGEFATIDDVQNRANDSAVTFTAKVSTHRDGLEYRHALDSFSRILGLNYELTKKILHALFATGKKSRRPKLLSLDNKAFYAFVINNRDQLQDAFKQISAATSKSMQTAEMHVEPTTAEFEIPPTDEFDFDLSRELLLFNSNAYEGYTSQCQTARGKDSSKPELMFEDYCENNTAIDWVYKNGDRGNKYFSIVYLDGLYREWLFYPDYIVKKRDGSVWLIETKGGEAHGQSQNIDAQSENKFSALQSYVTRYANQFPQGIHWGFVRPNYALPEEQQLRLNNTEYTEDMSNSNWQPLSDLL